MGAIYGHRGHLDLQTTTICTYFQSTFNIRLHIKFEEIWPRGFRGEVVQRCEGRTDGRRVVTIAHPEPLAGTKNTLEWYEDILITQHLTLVIVEVHKV